MKKSFAVLYLAIFGVIAVLSAQPDGQLTVWSFTDDLSGIINNYFKRDNRTVQIEYSLTPTDQLPKKLDEVLPDGRGAPDVFVMEYDFVRKYVESGLLLDLTDIYEENKGKLLKYPVDVGTHNGRVYALSWQANPGAMFYRRSLAKKYLGTDDPQVMQAYFSSTEKMMETAALLKDKSGGSCVLVSSREELFRSFLNARSSPWIVNGKLVIDPAMEQYMDVCKTLYGNSMEGRVGLWSQGWFEGMQGSLRNENGNQVEVFSYFLPSWGLNFILKTITPRTSGDWAMIPGPIPWQWGGTWIAAYKNTQNSSAAKELIRYITANENFHERYTRDTGELITSLPVIQKIQNNFHEPFLGGQNYYSLFAEIAGNVNGRLEQSTDSAIQAIFLKQVTAYVNEEKTKDQALEDFRIQTQNIR